MSRKTWNRIASGVVALGVAAGGLGTFLVLRQGLNEAELRAGLGEVKLEFDAEGVPTIAAADWLAVIKAQGFVVASERLWQMDLIRRKAGGRLAEFFGTAALAHDLEVQREDRLGAASRGVEALPPLERSTCEAYAQGVNSFITTAKSRWGFEYQLLRTEPEPWTCADSLLVLIEMLDTLTSTSSRDASAGLWTKHLSPAWEELLFPRHHPWNEPLFGEGAPRSPAMPPTAEWIPRKPLAANEAASVVVDPDAVGSNNWAWRGPTGAFLATDPHLGQSVPGIWYALRLRVAAEDWAVGVAIPGIPGVIIGMNPRVSWAFTNTGEDVDDLLVETVGEDGKSYLEKREGGVDVWKPIERKTFAVKVKGEAAPRQLEATFTHRGPLVAGRSRQWLALQPGVLRLPALDIMRAKDLAELDRALDGMRSPAQNCVAIDGDGSILYRTTGTGVGRRLDAMAPVEALAGEWAGLEPPESRPRRIYPATDGPTRFVATANERIWVDGFHHNWSADDRKDRIRRLLGSREDFTREDMERIQRDSASRFRVLLLKWVADRTQNPNSNLLGSLARWDGDSHSNTRAFTHATMMENDLEELLLLRVRDQFLAGDDHDAKYENSMRRAWLVAVLEAPGDTGFLPFGLTASEVAQHLLQRAQARDAALSPLHPEENRWRGQHPFVGRIPVLGWLFEVAEPPQWGCADCIAAEKPRFGPSMRIVWDMRKPWASTWVFPVGQSGHVASAHFKDFQTRWVDGSPVAVFPRDGDGFAFPGRVR